MIQGEELSKWYGDTLVADRLSFDVLAGRVTGFLGPNGSGKSTTMRMIMGLDAPSGGCVTVNGRPYGDLLRARVDEVLVLVGLTDVTRERAGTFSLGMGQRLGIAVALLGDPSSVLLDEPINGLDPEGIRWVRTLLRGLAAEGRTVFLSSHLMSEMALTAEHLVVIGRRR